MCVKGLHLALARDKNSVGNGGWSYQMNRQRSKPDQEYGERFQIEEELLDEKSNGFQLERSEIRSAPALSRLCERDGGCHTCADGTRTASGRSRETPLGRCPLATRQQLSENRLEHSERESCIRNGDYFTLFPCMDTLILSRRLPRKSRRKNSWSVSLLSNPTVLALEFCQSTRSLPHARCALQ